MSVYYLPEYSTPEERIKDLERHKAITKLWEELSKEDKEFIKRSAEEGLKKVRKLTAKDEEIQLVAW